MYNAVLRLVPPVFGLYEMQYPCVKVVGKLSNLSMKDIYTDPEVIGSVKFL